MKERDIGIIQISDFLIRLFISQFQQLDLTRMFKRQLDFSLVMRQLSLQNTFQKFDSQYIDIECSTVHLVPFYSLLHFFILLQMEGKENLPLFQLSFEFGINYFKFSFALPSFILETRLSSDQISYVLTTLCPRFRDKG